MMGYRLLADLTVLLHLAFVLFVVLGGLLALRWPRVLWWHLPAVVWGALVEFTGWICPLTPLENWFRIRGDQAAYDSDFVMEYVLPVLYPASLTRPMQIVLGALVLCVNVAVYFVLWRRGTRRLS
jgi:hypothetical protein